MTQGTTDRLTGNIRAELARRGVSRRDLAAQLGWSASGCNRRLSGRTPITVEELEAVAAYLELTVPDLMQSPHRAAS